MKKSVFDSELIDASKIRLPKKILPRMAADVLFYEIYGCWPTISRKNNYTKKPKWVDEVAKKMGFYGQENADWLAANTVKQVCLAWVSMLCKGNKK